MRRQRFFFIQLRARRRAAPCRPTQAATCYKVWLITSSESACLRRVRTPTRRCFTLQSNETWTCNILPIGCCSVVFRGKTMIGQAAVWRMSCDSPGGVEIMDAVPPPNTMVLRRRRRGLVNSGLASGDLDGDFNHVTFLPALVDPVRRTGGLVHNVFGHERPGCGYVSSRSSSIEGQRSTTDPGSHSRVVERRISSPTAQPGCQSRQHDIYFKNRNATVS